MHEQLKEPAANKVGGFIEDLKRLQAEVTTGTTASALELLNGKIGLGAVLASLDEGRPAGVRAANSDGVRSLMALAQLHTEASTFETWMREMLSMTQDAEGVALSSVHKVKGLEWSHVIVFDASEDVFPHRLSIDLEEERRVFHVAISRCQKSLLITTEPSAPSIFLSEMQAPQSQPSVPNSSAVTRKSAPLTPSVNGSRGSGRSSPRLPSRPPVVKASVGLRFRWSGYDCTVGEVNGYGAVVALGPNNVTVEFGERVTVLGNYRTLAADDGAGAAQPVKQSQSGLVSANPGLRDSLKKWRREQALAEGAPAFVVFYDTTLDELCERLPQTTSELRRVKGFGPVKVEKYGDSVLAIISENLL
jgi:hypothetical protein